MLSREENPPLFALVKAILIGKYGVKDIENCDTLSDDLLSKVETLSTHNIITTGRGLKSLKGIEKLPNLTSLLIEGSYIVDVNLGKKIYEDIKSRENDTTSGAENIVNEVISQYKDSTRKKLEQNQLEDLDGLDKCYNLKELTLSSQRKIKKLDINTKNLSSLFLLDSNIYAVNGLNNIQIDNESIISIRFCDNLNKLDNIHSLLKKASKNKDVKIELTLSIFSYLINSYPSLLKESWFIDSNITWYDINTPLTTSQMIMLKQRCDDIINTVCDKNKSDIYNISKIYRYICDNIKYADKQAAQEKSMKQEGNKGKEYLVLRDRIRSAFYALFDKESVCVGISALFNFFLSEMGIYSERVFCGTDRLNIGRELTKINHSISKLYIDDRPYYCDPTWDLGKERLKFFLLNEKEMENTRHQISIANFDGQSSPSLQSTLDGAGLLDSVEKKGIDARVYEEFLDLDERSL